MKKIDKCMKKHKPDREEVQTCIYLWFLTKGISFIGLMVSSDLDWSA